MKISIATNIKVGTPTTINGVTLFPLSHGSVSDRARFGTIADVEVSELGDGTVPTLLVNNPTPNPVLLAEGETLCGGRQNRTLNVSVLVPAGAEIEVPVSCVEAGRWGASRGRFTRATMRASRKVRAAKTRGVSRHFKLTGTRHSDQGEVWASIDHELDRMNVVSHTAAFTDSVNFIQEDAKTREAIRALTAKGPELGQAGVAVAHGSEIVSVEIFADELIFRDQFDSIVNAIMLDAPEEPEGEALVAQVEDFLRRVDAASVTSAPGVGLGDEHHFEDGKILGQGLTLGDRLVHLSCFVLD